MPESPVSRPRPDCRSCGGPLEPILDLGSPVLSDFLPPDAPDPPRAPLVLGQCEDCRLVQMLHTVDPHRLYRDHYWYRSGVNETMVEELHGIAEQAQILVPGATTALDVGCNDGTLLAAYRTGISRFGVEPCAAVGVLAQAHADALIHDFFPSRATAGIPSGSIDLLTAIAMFYDLDDPRGFVAEVDRVLSPGGVWIVQMQDLAQMLRATAFDNICHEHLCYYTPASFGRLLRGTNLRLAAVYPRLINGGSLRFVVSRPGGPGGGVAGSSTWEVGVSALDHFVWRVDQVRQQLLATLDQIAGQDLWIDLYAASTKSSTLLQYCGIDHRRIRQAVERTPEKWGLETSGTRIPIVSEDQWRVDPAPITLCGAWQYKAAFVEREAEYLAQGGAFLLPLPAVEVIYGQP